MDGELGEGRAATNLTTAILGSRRGGKHRGGAPGLFRSCGSVRGLVTRRRSSGAARGIVGTAVVAATANGGDGRVRWRRRERAEEGERSRERGEGCRGCWASPWRVWRSRGGGRHAGRSGRGSVAALGAPAAAREDGEVHDLCGHVGTYSRCSLTTHGRHSGLPAPPPAPAARRRPRQTCVSHVSTGV